MKIPLPKITNIGESKAHSYPFQIGLQTQELLQGTIFYVSFADIAAGKYIRQPGAMEEIEKYFREHQLDNITCDQAWDYLRKYQVIFEKTVYSNVLISLCSHWDWYIRHLSSFIVFALKHSNCPILTKKEHNQFSRIGYLPFIRQIAILEKVSDVNFKISKEIKTQLKEMYLVRNLGLHNRWEVDEKYLQLSDKKGFEIGDLRLVEIDELRSWHAGLILLINETAICVAKKFVNAPNFP